MGSVHRDLSSVRLCVRKFERAAFKPFLQNRPSGAIEVQNFHQVPTSAEEYVEMAIEGVEIQATNGACDRVERAAHIDGLNREKYPNRWR